VGLSLCFPQVAAALLHNQSDASTHNFSCQPSSGFLGGFRSPLVFLYYLALVLRLCGLPGLPGCQTWSQLPEDKKKNPLAADGKGGHFI